MDALIISKHGFEFKLISTLIILSWIGMVSSFISAASLAFVTLSIIEENRTNAVVVSIIPLCPQILFFFLHFQLRRNAMKNDEDGTRRILKIIWWMHGFVIIIVLQPLYFLVMTVMGTVKNRRIDYIKIQIIFVKVLFFSVVVAFLIFTIYNIVMNFWGVPFNFISFLIDLVVLLFLYVPVFIFNYTTVLALDCILCVKKSRGNQSIRNTESILLLEDCDDHTNCEENEDKWWCPKKKEYI